MAYYRCIGGNGGSGGKTKSVSYLKWKITKVRGISPHDGVLQATEFKLYQDGTLYSWNANASATSDMTPISGYEASKLIDGSNSTKFATSQWGNVQTNECNIIFSLGETITIDAKTTYSYITGNDEASRDPISWVLYGSADGINWEELDSQTDFTLITSRTTETLINGFLMAKVSGGSSGVTILSGTTGPTSSQGADGQIYLKYSDKEKLINSSRGSYINTGYVMKNNTVFEMKCKITGGGAWPVPFGARDVNSNNAGAKEWMVQIYGGYFRYDADIGLTNGPASSKYLDKEITMRLGNNKFYISSDDDTDEYTFTQGNPTTKTMFVFGLNAAGSYSYADSSAYMELYSFTIYEGDTIVHNFIPAYNNNQWCLYDEIDETYFYKLGSGSEFTGLEKDLIDEIKLKVNGTWQDLMNSDIDDVNLGD